MGDEIYNTLILLVAIATYQIFGGKQSCPTVHFKTDNLKIVAIQCFNA